MKDKWREFLETGMIEIGMEALAGNSKAVVELSDVIRQMIKDDPLWAEALALHIIELISFKYHAYKKADLLLWEPLKKVGRENKNQ